MALQSNELKDKQPRPSVALDDESAEGAEDEVSPRKMIDPKYKIQITLNPRQKNILFALRDETGVESAAQVVRDALRVYQYLVDELATGESDLFLNERATGNLTKVKLI